MAAEAQLERLLYVLPVAARAGGARLDELARALDVPPATILRDLEQAMARAFYHPAGTAESFTILIEGDVVHVHAPDHFRRPVRLNDREALALGLGLRALAAEREEPRRAEVLALAERLERELAAPADLALHAAYDVPVLRVEEAGHDAPGAAGAGQDDAGVEYDPELVLALGADALRGIVADAVESGRVCTIYYLKPGDAAPAHRRIAPYRLVHAEAHWYVAAHDLERDDFRFFRLDRVLDARVEQEPVPPLPEIDLRSMLRDGAAYIAREDVEVAVRYSPRVARWIVEQTGERPEPDGSVVVRHRVADARWLVRHVLQYGGDARVEAPAHARGWVGAAARRVAGGRA